jgi:TPR repeat protein
MVNIGAMYEKGDGVVRNDIKATDWFRDAAEAGDAVGQFCYGMHLKRGIGCTQDYTAALGQLIRAAESDHVNALYNLAVMYEQGQGCTRDYKQAAAYYRRAIEIKKHSKSMVNLGALLDKGLCGDIPLATSRGEAVQLYEEAAAQGDIIAKYNLSHAMLTSRSKASSDGSPEKESPVDKERALRLLKEAASTGLPQAQFNLAMQTLRTPREHRSKDAPEAKEAMQLLLKAADSGAEKASRSLAQLSLHNQTQRERYGDPNSARTGRTHLSTGRMNKDGMSTGRMSTGRSSISMSSMGGDTARSMRTDTARSTRTDTARSSRTDTARSSAEGSPSGNGAARRGPSEAAKARVRAAVEKRKLEAARAKAAKGDDGGAGFSKKSAPKPKSKGAPGGWESSDEENDAKAAPLEPRRRTQRAGSRGKAPTTSYSRV